MTNWLPAAKRQGETIDLRVNPANPVEVYDMAYDCWFARYRIVWGITACAGLFALVSLLQTVMR